MATVETFVPAFMESSLARWGARRPVHSFKTRPRVGRLRLNTTARASSAAASHASAPRPPLVSMGQRQGLDVRGLEHDVHGPAGGCADGIRILVAFHKGHLELVDKSAVHGGGRHFEPGD